MIVGIHFVIFKNRAKNWFKMQRHDQASASLIKAVVVFAYVVSAASALKMTEDVYEAFGDRGGTAELICKADEMPDRCKFIRSIFDQFLT